jgi:CRISPR type III-B/RAMP module RAMP protein Cmr1
MNTETFHLELITPCFCGGAEPEKRAEIRAPSIRGQLRWWFRTLGGFKSLASTPVPRQEAIIFGSTAGDEGRAGKLGVRIRHAPLPSTLTKDDVEFKAPVGSDRGYLAFPLRSKRDRRTKAVTEYKGRALYDSEDKGGKRLGLPQFHLETIWHGEAWIREDITALIVVLGELGSLGFRARRALGALALRNSPMPLHDALQRFSAGEQLRRGLREITRLPGVTRDLEHRSANDCISSLAKWLKAWRSHGRTTDHATARPPAPPHNPGFRYAKNDHDRGVDVGKPSGRPSDITYRPALGLPIIQFFSSGKPEVDWNESLDIQKAQRNPSYKGEGRFASPVLLRPHRDAQGNWHALVIFVEAHKWPQGKPVFLNGQPRDVSLELYEAMKRDPALKPWP